MRRGQANHSIDSQEAQQIRAHAKDMAEVTVFIQINISKTAYRDYTKGFKIEMTHTPALTG
jgi:uncharacterized pyridoxal phosphate-containing UPF0001 family protein